MQLAHSADDDLIGLDVRVDLEGRVFLHQLGERHAHLFLIGFGLRLDGHRDHRLGEGHGLQDDGLVLVADGVAGSHTAQTDSRADVTGPHFLDLFALVGMHLQQTADALGVPLGGVEHGRARLDVSGVDPEKRQLTDIRIGHDLEDQGRKGLVIRCLALGE